MGGKIALSRMIDLDSQPTYHNWSTAYSMGTFKSAVSKVSENGSYKLRNSRNGADWEVEVEVMRLFCFATEVLVLARHLSGKGGYSQGIEESSC